VILCDCEHVSVDATVATRIPRPQRTNHFDRHLVATAAAPHQRLELQMIEAVFASRGGGSLAHSAAARLVIPRQTLDSKITAFGIDSTGTKSLTPACLPSDCRPSNAHSETSGTPAPSQLLAFGRTFRCADCTIVTRLGFSLAITLRIFAKSAKPEPRFVLIGRMHRNTSSHVLAELAAVAHRRRLTSTI